MLYEELAIEHTNNHAVPLIMSLKTVANPRILDNNSGQQSLQGFHATLEAENLDTHT